MKTQMLTRQKWECILPVVVDRQLNACNALPRLKYLKMVDRVTGDLCYQVSRCQHVSVGMLPSSG